MISLEAFSDISSANKLSEIVQATSCSEFWVDSTFLQDLYVDSWALVKEVGFLQTFLEALETMLFLSILGLLWALETDPDFFSEEPFLWF